MDSGAKLMRFLGISASSGEILNEYGRGGEVRREETVRQNITFRYATTATYVRLLNGKCLLQASLLSFPQLPLILRRRRPTKDKLILLQRNHFSSPPEELLHSGNQLLRRIHRYGLSQSNFCRLPSSFSWPSRSPSMPSTTSDLVLHPNLRLVVFSVLRCTLLALLAHLSTRPRPVLLLDYSCFLLDIDRKCRFEVSQYIARRSRHYNQKSEDFMRSILLKSGLSDETYVPTSFQTQYEPSLRSGFQEAEEGMTLAVDARPSTSSSSSTSIVIVSCGMFTPAPSLSSLLVHRFALNIEDCKQDVIFVLRSSVYPLLSYSWCFIPDLKATSTRRLCSTILKVTFLEQRYATIYGCSDATIVLGAVGKNLLAKLIVWELPCNISVCK
ncbi:hypothetical protein Cni_G06180 [Canna indica]|uniref:FAE domain-containing protein n=1 Tax=Canna indica TaxID=4628 RepID=A0AAQ3JYX2_9LILI|nr:hypothetical protein Cni_G06180 [Canna indica]